MSERRFGFRFGWKEVVKDGFFIWVSGLEARLWGIKVVGHTRFWGRVFRVGKGLGAAGEPLVVQPRRLELVPQGCPRGGTLRGARGQQGVARAGVPTPQGSPSWRNLGGWSRLRRGSPSWFEPRQPGLAP